MRKTNKSFWTYVIGFFFLPIDIVPGCHLAISLVNAELHVVVVYFILDEFEADLAVDAGIFILGMYFHNRGTDRTVL